MTAITSTTFGGFAAVELSTPALKLIAVHGTGPRLAWLSLPTGDNLLLWDGAKPATYARTMPDKSWTLRGGHRVWTARGAADESEETYQNDDAPGTCQTRADGFTVMGAVDPVTRTRRGIAVTVLAADRLQVDNILVNEGDMLYGCGMWALTCTVPNPSTRYVIPLGDGSSWDTTTITVFRTWAGHGTGSFREEQFELTDDAYVLTPRGRETKRMIKAPHGMIAMVDAQRGCTFSISAPWEAGQTYPGDANLAMYVGPDNFMVEMETMGPMVVLKPGQQVVHRQLWRLQNSVAALTGGVRNGL